MLCVRGAVATGAAFARMRRSPQAWHSAATSRSSFGLPEAAERLGLTPRVCTPEAPEQLVIQPVRRIEGHIKLPGSKSLSNRVLLLAALAEGTTVVRNLLVRHPARAQLARLLTRFKALRPPTSPAAHAHVHVLAAQDSEDIRYMVGALKALGVQVDDRWQQQEATVVGCGGRFPTQGGDLFLGNAGTAMRWARALI